MSLNLRGGEAAAPTERKEIEEAISNLAEGCGR